MSESILYVIRLLGKEQQQQKRLMHPKLHEIGIVGWDLNSRYPVMDCLGSIEVQYDNFRFYPIFNPRGKHTNNNAKQIPITWLWSLNKGHFYRQLISLKRRFQIGPSKIWTHLVDKWFGTKSNILFVSF